MRNLEVDIPQGCNLKGADWIIRLLCKKEGLSMKTRGTLKSYPGSTHWHFNRRSEKGTLEVTLWPKESKIWFSIHDNRNGTWTDEVVDRLAVAARKAFESKRVKAR